MKPQKIHKRLLPISEYQKLFFLEWSLAPDETTYNVSLVNKINGNCNENILKQACDLFIKRNEVTHALYSQDGATCYYGNYAIDDFYHELICNSEQPIELQIKNILETPFDLTKDVLLRFYFLKGANENRQEFYFIILAHHIVADAISARQISIQIQDAYNAITDGNIPSLAIDATFTQAVEAEKNIVDQEYKATAKNFWLEFIGDISLHTHLPYRSGVDAINFDKVLADKEGELIYFDISSTQTAGLKAYAKQKKTTLFIVLSSLYGVVLSKYSNQEKLLLSYPTNTRPRGFNNITGCFVNNLPLKLEFDRVDRLSDLVELLGAQRKAIKPYHAYPLLDIIQDQRNYNHPTINDSFNAGISQTNLNTAALQLNNLEVSGVDISSNIIINEMWLSYDDYSFDTIKFKFEYRKELFDNNLMHQLINAFKKAVDEIVNTGEMLFKDFSALSPEEYDRIVYQWNDTDTYYHKDKSIIDLFEEQVAQTPDNIAIVFENNDITYQQLNEKSGQLANYLKSTYDIQANDVIGIMLDRSENMLIAILGILKSGAAYVCIDPEYPAARKEYIIHDTSLKVLITQSDYIFDLDYYTGNLFSIDVQLNTLNTPVQLPESAIQPTNLAYVIYTSGTTGNPKGVMISHKAILSLVYNDYIHLSENDAFAFLSSPAFDASTFEIFTPLLHGNKLVMPRNTKNLFSDINAFKYFLAANKISVLWLTKTLFDNLYHIDNSLFSPLNYLIIGGEALTKNIVAALANSEAKPRYFLNGYGPTESTTFTCTYDLTNKIGSYHVPIGKPIKNRSTYVLDKNKCPVPIGVVGELYIGGAGLSQGYLNLPELTHEHFIPNPFATEADKAKGYSRLYKTGDMVRWLPDGNLEFTGRNDNQVKINGYRIELGEIEHALSQIEGITQSCVVIKERKTEVGNTKYLIAYYIPANQGFSLTPAIISDKLSKELPEFMIPDAFVEMTSFSLTINGKLDKRFLPDPDFNSPLDNYVAPSTATETALCKIWEEVLELDKVGITDDFFKIGGDSILSIRLVARIKKSGFDITERDVFEYKTIRELVQHIDKVHPQEENSYIPFSLVSNEFKDRLLKESNILTERVQDIYPASYLQSGMLIESLAKDKNDTYHDVLSFKINAPFHQVLFTGIWQELIQKHEQLRTAFILNENGYFNVVYKAIDVDSNILIKNPDQYDSIQQFVNIEKHADFDLGCPGIFSLVILLNSNNENFSLIFSLPHAITDGWSVASLLSEFTDIYVHNKSINNDILPPYGQFIANECAAIADDTYKYFWLNYLSGYELKSNNLLINHSSRQQKDHIAIDQDLKLALNNNLLACARALKISPDTIFLGVYNLVLSLFYNTNDLVIGSVVNNRLEEEGGDRVFGLHLNTIPIRLGTNNDKNARDYLLEVFQNKLDINKYKQYPYAKIKADLNLQEHIYQCSFNYMHFHVSDENYRNQSISIEYSKAKTSIPLTLNVSRHEDAFSFMLDYDIEFIDRELAEKLIPLVISYLEQITDDPNKLLKNYQLLTVGEYNQIIYDWNATDKDYPQNETICALFEEQVAKTPDHIALVYEKQTLTYKELNEKSNQLARYIRAQYEERAKQPLAPGTPIALCLNRSLEMLIGILAILKAGGAYVPIDPNYPPERIHYIATDTKATLILSQKHVTTINTQLLQDRIIPIGLTEKIYQETSNTNLLKYSDTSNIAYIIYTSGTTGKPKGVMITHHAAVNYINNVNEVILPDVNNIDFSTSIAFDLTITTTISALLQGKKIFIYPGELHDTDLYARHLVSNKIDFIKSTPSLLASLPLDYFATHTIKQVFVGGEKLEDVQLAHISKYAGTIIDEYGPTETTVGATYSRKNISDKQKGIGKPYHNYKIYILDPALRPIPTGVTGELYIGGAGLSKGYLNHPDLTAARFIDNPFATELDKEKGFTKLYKTGDLARWTADGNIAYIGRNDEQVKIRGYRIELAEIEYALSGIAGILQNCVLVRERKTATGNIKYLVGYYILENEQGEITQNDIRNRLSQVLPEYMVPTALMEIKSLPLTINGKINKAALPDPHFNPEETAYVAPTTATEKAICHIWQELLGLDKVGMADNFFSIGGNSILAIQVSHRMSKVTGYKIKVAHIFRWKSIDKIINNTHTTRKQYGNLVEPYQAAYNPALADMIFIHPAHGGAEVYQHVADILSVGYNCIGIDNYNIHNDGKLTSLHSLASYYLTQYEQKYALKEPVNLLGWSLGGQIALEMAVMLERRGNKKINVILLDTYIRNKYIQQIGTRNFDKERLRQLSIEKEYDAEYIDKILSIVHIEEEIANSLISGYLLYTHAVLFKATQVEDEVHQIMTNNVDLVTENLKVIPLNCHHMNILETNSTTIGNYLLSKQSNIKGLPII